MAFKLKLTYGTVTRKLPLDSAPLDWPSLESQIQHRFGFDSDSRLTLSYDDADGDSITIVSFRFSDGELSEAADFRFHVELLR